MENHHFQWVNPLSMAIFNSYFKLPEGKVLPTPTIVFVFVISFVATDCSSSEAYFIPNT
jgi:hypothetical protein